MKRLALAGAMILISLNSFAWTEVTRIMDEGQALGIYTGASLLVGSGDHVLFQYSVGDSNPGRIYDVASLTKVVATTTLIMVLEEKGKLALTDRVSKYIPCVTSGVTLEDLHRHRAGLPAGARPKENETLDLYINRICQLKLSYVPGSRTLYSDLSYILLGRVVEIVSDKPLKELADEFIFRPLKMINSGFNVKNCAPTSEYRNCQVHDPTAFHFLPLHVGNAGLFASLDDLTLFVRMIVGKGEVNGTRIVSKATIEKMLIKVGPRGLGWDYEDEFFTAPRGEVFPPGISFGHTGYTGNSIWIDPKSDSYYIFVSNRVFMGDDRTRAPFSKLRKELSTAIGKKVYEISE
ncbi:MAG TPA: serine hydrolase domain-containing protein [Bacteriovoracaceae bacterium]|nr:serine hydrolase domain-containing protein [Bacteriovoracaceae bacterium]